VVGEGGAEGTLIQWWGRYSEKVLLSSGGEVEKEGTLIQWWGR